MKVLLMLYLCADASHVECRAIPVQGWAKPDGYAQCTALVPALTDALTEANRQRTYFSCEQQSDAALVQQAGAQLIHQSFRF
ncbi:hypothetical protein Q1W70_00485 [Pseudomonas kielensis]|uniref:hypothetical protein n=1 Tax=Pseudomonas kielensis TaxID=2762577 RepID=UPI00265E6002|nr:hypothetical protein [Pseudomonas kielensis]WKL53116.1 hypothetical protein Q1W70_00485 [Pseudomonas kielensis]